MTYMFITWIYKTVFKQKEKEQPWDSKTVDTNHTLLHPPYHGLDASPMVGLTLVIILLVAGIYCYMWVLEESKVFFPSMETM